MLCYESGVSDFSLARSVLDPLLKYQQSMHWDCCFFDDIGIEACLVWRLASSDGTNNNHERKFLSTPIHFSPPKSLEDESIWTDIFFAKFFQFCYRLSMNDTRNDGCKNLDCCSCSYGCYYDSQTNICRTYRLNVNRAARYLQGVRAAHGSVLLQSPSSDHTLVDNTEYGPVLSNSSLRWRCRNFQCRSLRSIL